jgi:hypothetical protein
MTDSEITEVIRSLHPDLKVGEMELRVGRALVSATYRKSAEMLLQSIDSSDRGIEMAVAAERERCAKIAEIEHMTPKDIVRVIRSNYPSD